jgi:acyl-CoA hydrolase
MPKLISPSELASHLPRGGRVLVQGASGESQLLAKAVMDAGEALGAMTFTGAIIPGVNGNTYLANADCVVETFFITAALKAAPPEQVRFLPLCYNDIRARLMASQIDAALFMVSPPDENGLCSFGAAVDFCAELWPQIPVRIAHINPLMPRTRGNPGIPFSEITAFVEGEEALFQSPTAADGGLSATIAGHIAPLVPDGATLQMGIGSVPGAVLRALQSHRNLRFHSGLIVDEVADLVDAGAMVPGQSVLAGVAIGTDRLYGAIGGEAYAFQAVSHTHGERAISQIPKFTAINSALEVDLFGQVYSELGPKGLMSGPGGASDYGRSVRLSEGGLRIIALAASAAKGAISRIVPPGGGAGPVSLGRMDVDLIVTEHGVADLRGKGYDARAEALIAIAPEGHRGALADAWKDFAARL